MKENDPSLPSWIYDQPLLRKMLLKGKEKGYILYDELNDLMPSDKSDPEKNGRNSRVYIRLKH